MMEPRGIGHVTVVYGYARCMMAFDQVHHPPPLGLASEGTRATREHHTPEVVQEVRG